MPFNIEKWHSTFLLFLISQSIFI